MFVFPFAVGGKTEPCCGLCVHSLPSEKTKAGGIERTALRGIFVS